MLKVGIVGLPNVGKSTLFKVLTKNPVDINNYPFCTIDPNIGIVPIQDKRLDKLTELSGSEKKIPTAIEFVDIAGLVKGAHKGEGLGNQFLSNIRNMDLICHVIRFFGSKNIKHIEDSIDPVRDYEIINTELILADLATVEKRKAKTQKIAKSANKEAQIALQGLEKLQKTLNQNKLARKSELTKEEKEILSDLHLITQKPFIYAFNISQDTPEEILDKQKKFLKQKNHVLIDMKTEEELLDLSKEEADELGLKSNIAQLPKVAYDTLNLITFFTTGPEESRAWTVEKGASAPEAGAKIHNDFKNKFIKAEVINYQEFVYAGSYKTAREKGLLRTEGKDYIVRDGDIIIFKI
ncbi:MAG: redox-regulated ATPase YchF [Candidatus Moranbacteria bacterium]|nr:redox-regulated ATPase YchF [Candidatus Moranbacteria bacterium]